ncbi:DUF4190 domain-containing protein [Leifsonia sp. NPDC077715]|uniref:DUF4190 domain-containing protein n=1 Tax=Leifsonia sp. NPDC077715 TaxID=3155539 RepID=UPI0034307E53
MSNSDPSATQPYGQAAPQPYGQPAGQPYPYAYPYPPAPRTNTLAIVSFVAAFVMSLAAVICGHIALAQIKRTGEGGRGFAIAGLVIGYIGVGFAAIFFVIWLVLFLSIMGHAYSTGELSS